MVRAVTTATSVRSSTTPIRRPSIPAAARLVATRVPVTPTPTPTPIGRSDTTGSTAVMGRSLRGDVQLAPATLLGRHAAFAAQAEHAGDDARRRQRQDRPTEQLHQSVTVALVLSRRPRANGR